MTIQRAFTTLSIAIGSIFALGTAPASAFSFNSGTALGDCGSVPLESLGANGTSVSTISSCTTADGITVTAGPEGGLLTLKEVNGIKGVGVFNDLHPIGSIQELDYGETITLSTSSNSIFSSLDISFLYQRGVFGDRINEVAQITAGGITGTLSVLNENTAEWNWNGISQTLTALSPSTSSGGGFYRILDPFGTTAVSSVTLTSMLEAGQSYRYSDYGVSGAEVLTRNVTPIPIPEPSMVLGTMGVAGAATFALSRRRSSSDRA